MVLSDGLSSNPSDTISRANELKQNGVEVIAIGIGPQICHEELLDIASDSSKVLFAGNDDLMNYLLKYQVMNQCLGKWNICTVLMFLIDIDMPRPAIMDLLYNEYCFQLLSHLNSRGTSVR